MKIGTKSLLFGAHCFFLHPIFVAIAWTRLYGFPLDLRLWVAFIVHDWGYWGKPNMDGPEGEEHVVLGANIMHFLFDWKKVTKLDNVGSYATDYPQKWYDFCLYHSRFYARKYNAPISRLCIADKLAFSTTPQWLYIFCGRLSGEIKEYMSIAPEGKYSGEVRDVSSIKKWHHSVHRYMLRFIAKHREGGEDTMTGQLRKAINEHGVY